MIKSIECWTANQLLPLLQDGELEPVVSGWLKRHLSVCRKHEAWRVPMVLRTNVKEAEPKLDLETLVDKMEAQASSRGEERLPDWLAELVMEYQVAPVPMAALTLIALFIGQKAVYY